VNYYERHLGDYAKDTAHLSMLEHGAYTLLLDRYYSTEQGIPADQAHRVARARTREEKAAVDAVLAEFFTLSDDTWVNNRAEEEIPKALARINAAQSNGKKGGRPKKNPAATQEKPDGFSLGSENGTQAKAHHTPDTNHQTPDINTHGTTPTNGGRVCLLMRQAGIPDGNPGHPDLLVLIAAGATDAEFQGAAATAAERGKGFAYALGTLKRQRQEAASAAGRMHQGPMPKPQRAPTAAEQRVLQAVPSLAAPHLRDAAPITIDAEVTDVTPHLLG